MPNVWPERFVGEDGWDGCLEWLARTVSWNGWF